MKKMNMKEKGITLIALVITIIVLLILAGVSIATLTGNNGILTRANEAKAETEEAKEDELRKLTALEAATNIENQPYTDKNGDTATIPAGFAVSQVEGENTIEDGLVIIDSKGNEFVWVPVNNINDYERNVKYEETIISNTAYDYTGYLPVSIATKDDREKELISVSKGFYIARYESGKQETSENSYILAIKKNMTVYGNVSQNDCQILAESFLENSYVVSALISGRQWDATMRFINGKLDGTGKKYNIEEYSENRHIGELDLTGQNEADRVANIYDLEGNAWEYIAEKTNYAPSYCYIQRGGTYATLSPASKRRNNNGNANNDFVSFRIVLYIL